MKLARTQHIRRCPRNLGGIGPRGSSSIPFLPLPVAKNKSDVVCEMAPGVVLFVERKRQRTTNERWPHRRIRGQAGAVRGSEADDLILMC